MLCVRSRSKADLGPPADSAGSLSSARPARFLIDTFESPASLVAGASRAGIRTNNSPRTALSSVRLSNAGFSLERCTAHGVDSETLSPDHQKRLRLRRLQRCFFQAHPVPKQRKHHVVDGDVGRRTHQNFGLPIGLQELGDQGYDRPGFSGPGRALTIPARAQRFTQLARAWFCQVRRRMKGRCCR